MYKSDRHRRHRHVCGFAAGTFHLLLVASNAGSTVGGKAKHPGLDWNCHPSSHKLIYCVYLSRQGACPGMYRFGHVFIFQAVSLHYVLDV